MVNWKTVHMIQKNNNKKVIKLLRLNICVLSTFNQKTHMNNE